MLRVPVIGAVHEAKTTTSLSGPGSGMSSTARTVPSPSDRRRSRPSAEFRHRDGTRASEIFSCLSSPSSSPGKSQGIAPGCPQRHCLMVKRDHPRDRRMRHELRGLTEDQCRRGHRRGRRLNAGGAFDDLLRGPRRAHRAGRLDPAASKFPHRRHRVRALAGAGR